MPNITIYLSDDEYKKFKEMPKDKVAILKNNFRKRLK